MMTNIVGNNVEEMITIIFEKYHKDMILSINPRIQSKNSKSRASPVTNKIRQLLPKKVHVQILTV